MLRVLDQIVDSIKMKRDLNLEYKKVVYMKDGAIEEVCEEDMNGILVAPSDSRETHFKCLDVYRQSD